MNMIDITPQLSQHSLCGQLTSEQIDALAKCGSTIEIASQHFLFQQGEDATHFYLIQKGKVAIELSSPPRGILSIQTLSEGDLLGWSWLYPPYRWRFDALATEDVQVITFESQSLREAMVKDHELGYVIMKEVIKSMGQRLESSRLQLLDMYGRFK